jgi:hypothetical protein
LTRFDSPRKAKKDAGLVERVIAFDTFIHFLREILPAQIAKIHISIHPIIPSLLLF